MDGRYVDYAFATALIEREIFGESAKTMNFKKGAERVLSLLGKDDVAVRAGYRSVLAIAFRLLFDSERPTRIDLDELRQVEEKVTTRLQNATHFYERSVLVNLQGTIDDAKNRMTTEKKLLQELSALKP